ncbi:hypothetical protein HMPREF9141_0280 [Prevotella multiformis DSM 16608]|uniref:Uncharacterized protein n=1 Tax=Prevotella multiformis DSM 16608 TaxID=888743 RepID=F0F3W4_9BACT|nr:hypothetical protein HMPREF9141_0280 [Prevotella multiformis DSM 16608]
MPDKVKDIKIIAGAGIFVNQTLQNFRLFLKFAEILHSGFLNPHIYNT